MMILTRILITMNGLKYLDVFIKYVFKLKDAYLHCNLYITEK